MTKTASRFLPDTSCMVAAVCAWHEHNPQAGAEIERRLSRGQKQIVAAPALLESYAVLTRLPPPHRLPAADAHALLEANFMDGATVVTLTAPGCRTLLRRAVTAAIVGGHAYDAAIAACALKARVATLLTFNARHFRAFEDELEIVVPGGQGGAEG